MFDLFGVTRTELTDHATKVAGIHLAIVKLLVDRGLFTAEEFYAECVRQTAVIDQYVSQAKAEQQAELIEKYPFMAALIRKAGEGC